MDFLKPFVLPVAAVESLRGDSRVDGDRLALWFFSGGGLQEFVGTAPKPTLEIVDVPEGRHSFDVLDDDASRAAINRATDLVIAALTGPAPAPEPA